MTSLGRRVPTDWKHVDRYPLRALTAGDRPTDVPVPVGVNWYTAFDRPARSDGRWRIGWGGDLGTVRGGHSVCLLPARTADPAQWWSYYDQGNEGACFPAGTFVRMADGSHKPIEQIRVLERVATAEGRDGLVLETMARRASALVRVRLRGHRGLECTPEHPILTRRGYIAATDLEVGDQVAVTRYLPADEEPINTYALVDLREFRGVLEGTVNTGGVMTQVAHLPPLLYRWSGLGRLLGLYAAEGSTTANKVVWSFGHHEQDTLVLETTDLIKQCFGAIARVQDRLNGAVNVVLYGKAWRRLFEALIPGTSKHGDKHLSGHVTHGPRDYLEALLEGWLDGDGHRRRGGVEGISASSRLALDMHAVANGLGRAPTLHDSAPSINKHAAARHRRWSVGIAAGRSCQSVTDDAATWRKVTALERMPFDGWVFNLEVEGDHSYVAAGIGVHNCVGFGCTRMMSLLNRRRYDARWLYRQAQLVDEYSDTPPAEGTSVRAGLDILRTVGHRRVRGGAEPVAEPNPADGIAANRWATDIDDVLSVLGRPGAEEVPLLNSWGRSYPHRVWIPSAVLGRLLAEDGEFGVVTDR